MKLFNPINLKNNFKNAFKFDIQSLTLMGILLACEILLSRFLSLSAWNIKIGFAFVPLVICAIFLGPVKAMIVSGLADVIGALLFPIGPYFPGFTITAALTGLIFGIFLYRTHHFFNVLLAVLISQIFGSLLLNTYWISYLYDNPFNVVFISRIPQFLIMTAVQTTVIYALTNSSIVIYKSIFSKSNR